MMRSVFARELLALWSKSQELGLPQPDFSRWDGATKDLLLTLGLEWNGEEYVIALTADTIYDGQIEQLLRELDLEGDDATYARCVVATHDQPTPVMAVRAAREFCAEVLNARRRPK